MVRDLGVDFAQGYHLGKPEPVSALRARADPLERDQERLIACAGRLLQPDLAGAVAAQVGVVASSRRARRPPPRSRTSAAPDGAFPGHRPSRSRWRGWAGPRHPRSHRRSRAAGARAQAGEWSRSGGRRRSRAWRGRSGWEGDAAPRRSSRGSRAPRWRSRASSARPSEQELASITTGSSPSPLQRQSASVVRFGHQLRALRVALRGPGNRAAFPGNVVRDPDRHARPRRDGHHRLGQRQASVRRARRSG